jgi:hypothetical protein
MTDAKRIHRRPEPELARHVGQAPRVHPAALGVPGAAPTGYGLGKAGWVSLTFRGEAAPPAAVLCDGVEGSYRIVAPMRLIAALDARGDRAVSPGAPSCPVPTA